MQLMAKMDVRYGKVMLSRSKKHIYLNTNYRTEMKLVTILMVYWVLQFDALKVFLRVHLHGRSQPNFNFFSVNPQNFQ